MNTQLLFSIFDRLLGLYSDPMVLPSDELALYYARETFDPADGYSLDQFDLFQIGTFDHEAGYITSFPVPKLVGCLGDVSISLSHKELISNDDSFGNVH
jgi:hypothetical protein